MKNRILLLSGTSEGPLLARALADLGFAVRATVTRHEACHNLFGATAGIQVEVRGFTEETLEAFLHGGEADIVLDATHPFAVRITRIAHDVCRRLGVPYVRYERPDWQPPEGAVFADGFVEAATLLPSLGRRIMLTIGAKQLKHFAHLHDSLTLFARILPSAVSVEQAQAAGFTSERILCLRPPFSTAFNRAIFEEYRTDTLLTKASGSEGGVVEKVTAALGLGMKVLMIRRPVLPDIAAHHDLAEAVAAVRRLALSCRATSRSRARSAPVPAHRSPLPRADRARASRPLPSRAAHRTAPARDGRAGAYWPRYSGGLSWPRESAPPWPSP
jgi:precorrin-6A/cobalt-precorrin-6A reductase